MALIVVGLAHPMLTAAPAVELSIRNGRVWLVTDRATVGEILAEWGRVGHTQIVDAGRITGRPLTLDLKDVSELEALDVILRSAGGFLTVLRTSGIEDGGANASRFSRVVIVPRAPMTAAQLLPPAPRPPAATESLAIQVPMVTDSGARRVIGPDGQPVPDDQEDAPDRPVPWVLPVLPPGASMPPGFSERPDAPPPRRPRPGATSR